MSTVLFLAQSGEGFGSLIATVLFVLFSAGAPLVRRLLEWLSNRGTPGPDAQEPGAEMWRRLLQGEEPAGEEGPSDEAPWLDEEPWAEPEPEPSEPRPVPVASAGPSSNRPPVPQALGAEGSSLSPIGSTLGSELEAFEGIGLSGPSREARGRARREPIGELRRRLLTREGEDLELERPRRRPSDGLRNAVLWAEILAPPVALRGDAAE